MARALGNAGAIDDRYWYTEVEWVAAAERGREAGCDGARRVRGRRVMHSLNMYEARDTP